MNLLYNFCLLFFGLLLLPKWLWQLAFQRKYRHSLKQRFGMNLPQAHGPSIWLHMVSVGEVRAMIPLYGRLKKAHPKSEFFLSTVTETGLAEARRCLSDGTAYFTLPFDFSWTMRRLAKQLKPTLLLLSEGDLWLNMLTYAKKEGARIALVSGKLSERSARRYAKVPRFAKCLFDNLDLICAQNPLYSERFKTFSHRIQNTGNLKFDITLSALTLHQKSEWQKRLGIGPNQQVLVIGSTHPGEEQLLLQAALSIPNLKILIVPRHPERFESVFAALPKGSGRLSDKLSGEERIVLIDAMGLLTTCYQLASLAIVGGSFIEGIGGHNVLEPIQAQIPVLFGPHMKAQNELATLVLTSNAGRQLSASELPKALNLILGDQNLYHTLQANAIHLAQSCRGATERTWNALFP